MIRRIAAIICLVGLGLGLHFGVRPYLTEDEGEDMAVGSPPPVVSEFTMDAAVLGADPLPVEPTVTAPEPPVDIGEPEETAPGADAADELFEPAARGPLAGCCGIS